MDQVQEWAIAEFKKLMLGDFLDDSDLRPMFQNLVNSTPDQINKELSNLLDFTQKDVKKFIKEFQEKIKTANAYIEKVKKLQNQTNQMNKEYGGTQKSTVKVRGDISKYLVQGRKICYCQATKHAFVNNCMSCGKIICEQEGQGPCLFCGAWVDKELMQDLDDEDSQAYKTALEHRDKLLDFDLNAARRLGVLDERSDWYELSNNTWLNKDQRNYAGQMLEIQKKKELEAEKMNILQIDVKTGQATLTKVENEWSEFGFQNEQVNQYMADQGKDKSINNVQQVKGAKFKPFEFQSGLESIEDQQEFQNQADVIDKLNKFQFKACPLTDDKSKDLFDKMNQDTNQSVSKKKQKAKIEEPNNSHIQFQLSSFSQRLQTENPFEEFRKAVEDAYIQKALLEKKEFKPDQVFFKDSDDIGMCFSMHQPWASLLVFGFKRFEGRDWNHKYRGPLYVHSTQKKPTQEEIDRVEQYYSEFYKSAGESIPPFPERYLTGCLLGRVDLIDVITHQEYEDTIPKKLQEQNDSQFMFVVRNPQYLDIPLKMSGQPNIYKLPKELLFGVKDKLKPAPYQFWPPEQFKNQLIGRFDIYPEENQIWTRDQIISFVEKNQIVKQSQQKQLSLGCFQLKNFLNASGQQGFIDSIREMINENPGKMRFQRSEKLAAEYIDDSNVIGNDSLISDKKREMAIRNSKKFGCYVLDLSHREMPLHEIKMLGLTIEEGVNLAVKNAADQGKGFDSKYQGQQNLKAQYQRYIFDFFKENDEDQGDQGGYTQKIDLKNIGSSGSLKNNKLLINYFAIAFGATIEIEYEIVEEGQNQQILKVVLESGDAFVANSLVKNISYSVKKTTNKYSQQLIIRQGCLLLQAEKD